MASEQFVMVRARDCGQSYFRWFTMSSTILFFSFSFPQNPSELGLTKLCTL